MRSFCVVVVLASGCSVDVDYGRTTLEFEIVSP
jgi:hypothetical protein